MVYRPLYVNREVSFDYGVSSIKCKQGVSFAYGVSSIKCKQGG